MYTCVHIYMFITSIKNIHENMVSAYMHICIEQVVTVQVCWVSSTDVIR